MFLLPFFHFYFYSLYNNLRELTSEFSLFEARNHSFVEKIPKHHFINNLLICIYSYPHYLPSRPHHSLIMNIHLRTFKAASNFSTSLTQSVGPWPLSYVTLTSTSFLFSIHMLVVELLVFLHELINWLSLEQDSNFCMHL